jgi:esterase/lipase superfamily enzyme
MSVALVIQHPKRLLRVVIFGVSGPTMFFGHYVADDTIFGKKVAERKLGIHAK